MQDKPKLTLEAALQAQSALRASAGLEPETFPVADFVGMISDEIEHLRKMGRSDDDIASVITDNSPVQIDASTITQYYAPPEARPHRE